MVRSARWRILCLGAALFSLAFALRTVRLEADPPGDLSWSLAPFTDDPKAMTRARLEVQHAQGLIDTPDYPNANPFLTRVLTGVMFGLGTGLWQGRLLFAVIGSLSCVLLFLFLQRAAGTGPAFVAGSFLATNFITVEYNRLALEETWLVFFGLAALLVARPEAPGEARAIFSGALAAAGAILIKLHGLLFVLILGLYPLFAAQAAGDRTLGRFLRWWGCLAAGFLLVWGAGAWLGLKPVYAPLGQYFAVSPVGGESGTPAKMQLAQDPRGGALRSADRWMSVGIEILKDLPGRYLSLGLGTRFWDRMALTGLLGWICLVSLLAKPCRQTLEEPPAILVIATWLTGALLALGLLRYRPLRYETLLIPPLCALEAWFLYAIVKQPGRPSPGTGSDRIRAVATFLGLLPVLHALLHRTCERLVHSGFGLPGLTPKDFPVPMIWPHWNFQVFFLAFIASLLLTILVLATQPRFLSAWSRAPGSVRAGIAIVLGGISLVLQLGQYVRVQWHPEFNTVSASRDLRAILPPGSVVAGGFAEGVTMETALVPCSDSQFRGEVQKLLEAFPKTTHVLVDVEGSLQRKVYDAVHRALHNQGMVAVRAYWIGPRWRSYVDARGVGLKPVIQILFRISSGQRAPATDFERGAMGLWAGEMEAAENAFRAFLGREPDHVPTLLQLALLGSRKSGQPAQSTEFFLRAKALVKMGGARVHARDQENVRLIEAGESEVLLVP